VRECVDLHAGLWGDPNPGFTPEGYGVGTTRRLETDMADTRDRRILAASFSSTDGGTRGAGAVAGAFPDRVGNTAVLVVREDGQVKFVESKDWGAGRGALVGGVIGILGGPLGMIAGGGIGALAAKLRDSGFKNDQLEALGKSMTPGSSATVLEIASDTVDTAKQLLSALGAREMVLEPLDSDVDDLFAGDAAPAPESEIASAARPG
jgi:uncharacterized membrane protein